MIEEEVWRVFERASGHHREKFRLERVEGGWVVRWADRASTPMGMAPWVVTDGGEAIAIRSVCYLALSYDHRLVDGADAARYLMTVKKRLEEGDFAGELGL